jgi:para-aminobenzoate synthetase/4-amino-4-deoxychorismate lyase
MSRGLTTEEDRRQRQKLQLSEKDRAENTMIVDMVRNDLGRVSAPGSIGVSSLFHVQKYPTMFQMTSTVSGKSDKSFSDIVRVLFPCASITGAPKIRTMEIIRELETSPRGIYTGCIGYLAPNRKAQFNVAIRTLMIDPNQNEAEYGVGGGVVWDSTSDNEFKECQTKSLVLMAHQPKFELLETILWDGPNGYFLLPEHLDRLKDSAEYFDISIDIAEVNESLLRFSDEMRENRFRVRLLVNHKGEIRLERILLEETKSNKLYRLGLAESPVDSSNIFLYHKTTHRKVYENARSKTSGYDDIILWNTRNEITETRIGNIVIRKSGKLITPPVSCGLLPGVFRKHLLQKGEITEEVIHVQDISQADEIYMINSVRKWVQCELISFDVP